ncbi:hypothetical protein HELRODRAFT_82507, partial [Helobdella robusta]|uniref:Helicase ATP-binding domain-containing protein n=1 Tax=Helobdella robusta TaxID=6412 RepID=T1G4T0_HELRO
IIKTIEQNPVVMIQGETGCGKSTQVPQFILFQHMKYLKHCNIVVTQPRKIAAISVAKRVCAENGWEIGGLCGYQVGLENVSSDHTCLLFCTTGVLLQKLITAKTIDNYTHVILDEVHERSQEMDFTMLTVRKLLREKCPNVKVSFLKGCAGFMFVLLLLLHHITSTIASINELLLHYINKQLQTGDIDVGNNGCVCV